LDGDDRHLRDARINDRLKEKQMETISIKEAARRLDVPQKDITLLIETKELTEAEGGG